MADLNDLLAALRAVADEHGSSDDSSDVDSEAGEDGEEEGADSFSRKRKAEMLLARVQQQKPSRSRTVTPAKDQKDIQLRYLVAKTTEMEAEISLNEAIDAQLTKHTQAYMALKHPKAKRRYPDPHNWREEATLEFSNRKL